MLHCNVFAPNEEITMEDRNGFMSKRSNFDGRSMKDEDFGEEDLWGIGKESEDSSPRKMRKYRDYNPFDSSWHISRSPRMIPKANNNTPTTTHEVNMVIQQSSAPMDIPDWSKIYKKNTYQYYNGVGINDDEDRDDDDMVPPHEWIARKLARNQISSFSVYEGIGRRLKGRDLSKVRNSILTKTGFLE